MIGLTGHPSTSSERTVKPSLPRLKWVAFLTQQNPINITMTAPLRLIFILLLSLGMPLSSLAQNDNSVVALLTLTPPPAQSAPVIQQPTPATITKPPFTWQEIWRDHRIVIYILSLILLITLAVLISLFIIFKKLLLTKKNLACQQTTLDQLAAKLSATQRTHDLYYKMVALGAGAITLFDIRTLKFIEFNDAACQGLGYSREEFAKLHLHDIHTDKNEHETQQLIQTILSTGHAQFASIHRHKNGSWRHMWVSSNLITLDDKAYFITQWTDVTHYKILEASLHRQEKHLQQAQHIGKLGSWFIELLSNTMEWSPETYHIFGKTPEQAIDLEFFFSCIHDDDKDRVSLAWQAALKGQPYDIEHRIMVNDEVRWVHGRGKINFTDNGIPLSGTGSIQDITEHKHTEAVITEERNRLQDIIDATHAGTWEWNIITGEAHFNPRWYQLFGYTEEDMHSLSIENWQWLIHPDDFEQANDLLVKHLTGESEYYECELRMRHKDGHWLWIADHGRIKLSANDGSPMIMNGIHLDISERKTLELDLRKLSLAVEQNPNSIVITNLASEVEYCNASFTSMSGYSKQEMLGKTIHLKQSGLIDSTIYKEIYATLNKGLTWEGELINKTKTGRLYNEHLLITPIKQANGTISHYLTISNDITEHKKTQLELASYRLQLEDLVNERTLALAQSNQKLIASEQRFTYAAEASSEGIWDWAIPENHAHFNLAYFTMLGYEANDFKHALLSLNTDNAHNLLEYAEDEHRYDVVQTWINLLHPDDKESAINRAYEDLSSQSTYESEFRMRAKNGSYHWILSKGKVVNYANDHTPLRAVGTHIDISLRKQTELALLNAKQLAESASEAKSNFLANMSHEIRTPMNAILGLTYLIQRDINDPQQLQRLDKVKESARHLLSIINDILDLSKIEANHLPIEKIEFNIATHVDNVCSLFKERVDTKGLELYQEIDTRLMHQPLIGDPLRIDQILLNFLSNALKFTETGSITLRVKLLNETDSHINLRFETQDTGIGMSEAQQQRIFEAFEQAEASTTRKYGGTGLGLTISRRLVELMAGEIGVLSRPSIGSTFWFTLPLERGLGINLQQPEHSQAQFKSNAHILLVEDNLINQIVAQELLESVGMTIDVANNGQEAINKVNTTRYDLILMDMQMPVLDGISATRIIRTLDNGHHLPIIAMTANVFTDDRLRCLDAGMNAHIAKPVDPSILYSTLAQWIPETAITDDSTSPSLDTTANLAIDSEINFPMIFSSPLLDMPTGLVYFGGNQQAYFKMLAQFISLHQHDIETINTLLEQNNVHDAERLAHTLKGISATLGANTLKELSFSIETALRHADNTENLADLLTEAHQELTTLCQFITDLNIAPPQPIAHKLSPENFKIHLTKLIMLLEDDDLESAYILESLLPLLKEKITQEHADLLLEQMNNYDFENALNNLQALIKLHPEWR